MIDVAEIINDPDFYQSYIIHRKGGYWLGGTWKETDTEISSGGVVIACNAKDLEQIPEGDRVKGMMCFYNTSPLYVTRDNGQKGTSDQIFWNSELYRLDQVFPYSDYGYYKAIGYRIKGN